MNDRDALAKAQWLIARSGQAWNEPVTLYNFKRFADTAADAVKHGMTAKQRESLDWLIPWAERFSALSADFDERVRRDPLVLYQARTPKHQAFHDSPAFIRYGCCANGIGKTNMAFAEVVWCATGQKHWAGQRGNAVVVSTGHTVFSEKVFVVKMVKGEDGDALTPMVPENGRYFHSFDQRKYMLRLSCEECAEANKPKECAHTKSITCLSADSQVERLMGFTARLAHLDEGVPVDVYRELRQRVRRGGANGRMIVTATPLAGPDHWTVSELLDLAKNRPEDNWLDKDSKTTPFVEVFQISKYDCVGTINGPTMGQIEAEKATLPDSEYRVRILGEPVPLADDPVFDIGILDQMEKEDTKDPDYYILSVKPASPGEMPVSLETLQYGEDVLATKIDVPAKAHEHTGFRVWKLPEEGKHYVIGADTASGTGVSNKKRDASAAYVFEVQPQDDKSLKFEMVACFWGYTDVWLYAANLKLLGNWYNLALIIPEVNGIGMGLAQDLARRLCYPNIYVGENNASLKSADMGSSIGVITSAQSKPLMAEALKVYIADRKIVVRDKQAIAECRAFQQNLSESGRSYVYEAASGMHDDRVLAMAFVAFAALYQPIAVAQMGLSNRKKPTTLKPGSAISRLGLQRKRFI